MPEQASKRGQPITAQNFEAPFETEVWPYGQGGLNLKDAPDAVPVGSYTRLTNVLHAANRALEARPGLTSLATAGTNHHSVRRLNDPQNSTFTRFWGVDQSLYLGSSGALAAIDAGYSGDPITLLPHRPPLSGDPWMFVADRSRMRKARFDGLVTPIGLPAPTNKAVPTLGTKNVTLIADWTVGSDTDPALWTPNKGFTYDDPPVATDLPQVLHLNDCPDADSSDAIHFGRIASSVRPTGDYVFFGLPLTRDLSKVGVKDASDDDYLHLWLNFSHPLLIEEFRLYVVVGSSFSPTVLPGVPDGHGSNLDAYVKSFSQHDFAAFFQAQADGVSAAEAARVHDVRDQSLQQISAEGGFAGEVARRISAAYDAVAARQDAARAQTVAGPGGADQYHELGILGVPVRRGDFQRMGETPNRDWSTVTGLVMMIKSAPNSGPGPIAVRVGRFYLHGGESPDTGEPGAQPYDYRYTHYDPRTGAEGNPSPVMTDGTFLDSLRRSILITPTAFGDGAVRQRFYRRGGSNIADWNFLGVNAADGGVFTDILSDDSAAAAGTVNLDHYQPVPTVDDTGATVLAQPVPILFGPANGLLFALGDPYRPGHLYWCIPDEPDHWPAESNFEVCSPSEELMAGFLVGAQPFCFSRERLYAIYPNLSGATEVTVSTTACKRGIVGRQAFAVGMGGAFGVATDGVFVTDGGAEQVISQEIENLFRGKTWNGYPPIDFVFATSIRLSIHQDVLRLLYQGTDGAKYVIACLLLYNRVWISHQFAPAISYVQPDTDGPAGTLLVGGKVTGKSYTHAGFSDDGAAIAGLVRTNVWDLGRPREDKLLGDQILDADPQGVTLTLQNRLNNETVVNAVQGMDAATGRQRYIFDSFGTTPQRARNISTEIAWSSASARPVLYFLGQSILPEPDQTLNRMTQWDDFGHPDESYFTGVTFDCDTGAQTRSIIIQRDFAGVIDTVATLTVNTDGRHKIKFSWPAVPAHKWRIFPNDDCKAWILYKADPIALPEPPRVAGWDIHFEAEGDQYYTGLDLFCDTGGVEKSIQISVDGTILTNPYTSEAFWRINAAGRKWVHLTFLAGRGHVFHFVAIDQNPGLLYKHKWYTEEEPSEQSNWNQNFSAWGTQADKWLKAIVFEADTFGINKTVRVEVDGTLADTLTVNCNGRLVQQLTLTTQQRGRIWRIYPSDGNPGRLYTAVPLFDVEPYKLNRWETQETDHDLPGFQTLIDAQITLRSTAIVTLTISIYVNQTGTILTRTYQIPSTEDVKLKRYVPFLADKGVLFKYLFTSPADFFLYQEESSVQVQPWGGQDLVRVQPWGDDDLDRTRNMTLATVAAARSGGGT